jgi:hypothetical protein
MVLISQAFHLFISALQQINFSSFKAIYVSFIGLILPYLFISLIAHYWLNKKKEGLWLGLITMVLFAGHHLWRSVQISKQLQLIVYKQNSASQIELILGNSYQVLRGTKEANFATKNARIAFGALIQKKQIQVAQVIVIAGKKIMLLDSNTRPTQSFPADILVLQSWGRKIDVKQLKLSFSPSQIVLAYKPKQYQIGQWEEQCNEENIALHYTNRDGAFIFPKM